MESPYIAAGTVNIVAAIAANCAARWHIGVWALIKTGWFKDINVFKPSCLHEGNTWLARIWHLMAEGIMIKLFFLF